MMNRRGHKDDFAALKNAGVSLEGKIALARYGGPFRGVKVQNAQANGMVGVVIYSDPGDDGPQVLKGQAAYPSMLNPQSWLMRDTDSSRWACSPTIFDPTRICRVHQSVSWRSHHTRLPFQAWRCTCRKACQSTKDPISSHFLPRCPSFAAGARRSWPRSQTWRLDRWTQGCLQHWSSSWSHTLTH